MNTRVITAFVVLAILIVGGLFLYKQNSSKLGSKTPVVQNKVQPRTQTTGTAGQPLRDKTGLPQTPATSSGKQVDDFIQTVKEDAKATANISITNCKISPAVAKLKAGSKITIKNNDSKEASLQVVVGGIYTVAAGKTQTFDLKIEPAIYAFACVHTGGDTVVRSGVFEVEK